MSKKRPTTVRLQEEELGQFQNKKAGLQTPYAEYLIFYLGSPALPREPEFVEEFENDFYQPVPSSTKLAQIIHNPVLLNHMLDVETQIKDQVDSDINHLFFEHILAHTLILPDTPLKEYIDDRYPLHYYNKKQTIFIANLTPASYWINALEVLKANNDKIFKEYQQNKFKEHYQRLENMINSREDKSKSAQILQLTEDFLDSWPSYFESIRKEKLPLEEEIEKITDYLSETRNKIEALAEMSGMEHYFTLFGQNLKDEPQDYRLSIIKSYISKNKGYNNDERESLLNNIQSVSQILPYHSLTPQDSYQEVRSFITHMANKRYLGPLLTAWIHHNPHNISKKEKRWLQEQIAPTLLRNETVSLVKSGRSIIKI